MRLGDESILPEDLPETITVPGIDYTIDVPRTQNWLTAPTTVPRWVLVALAAVAAMKLLEG